MSVTYLGAYIGLAAMILRLVGVQVAEEELQKVVEGAAGVVSLVLIVIGRHRKGGVSWLGTRQPEPAAALRKL